MPTNVECESCGLVVLGYEGESVRPLNREECPDCGGTEFRRVD